MKITDIRIRLVRRGDEKLKGVASIIIDDSFAVHDIKIISGAKGLFISMPNRKMLSGEHKDIFHPIRSDARETLHNAIIYAYETALAEDAQE